MKRNHAIVIGGSVGGLLAVRVLTDHFDRVTLIERDVSPAAGENRRGVPQGRHTHGLLASGRQILDKLFPGLCAELLAEGAVHGDIAAETRWFQEGGYLARRRSGLDGVLVTRPKLEGAIRERVRALPNLAVIQDSVVDSLLATDDRRRITGVHFATNGVVNELAADLVIDASGRASKTPLWLSDLGYELPATDEVDIALAYTTRFFRREPQHLDGDIAAIIPPTPGGKCGGVMLAQEGGRWTVTLISHFGPAAPRELEEFREFARSLPAPIIYETIRTAEPVGEPATARLPSSIRRRYENLARFPEGYLVLGDAICSFNPIYGQGMSVAALQAQVLNDSLVARDDAHLARRFFRKTAAVVDIPWSVAVGNDLRMPETQGPRGAGVQFINWYMSRLHRAAHRDAELAVAFHRVANLLAPPQTLFRPAMAFRVLVSLCATAVLSRCAVQRSYEAQTVRQSRGTGAVSLRDRSVTGAGPEWANSAE